MSNEFIKICDICGKRTKAESADDTPVEWYNILELDLYWGTSDSKKEYSNRLEVRHDNDPDFCSRECAIKWFEKQLDKIKTKKYAVK